MRSPWQPVQTSGVPSFVTSSGRGTRKLWSRRSRSASVLRDFEERRAYLAACGVFRLSDYLDEVVQPLWSYWALDRCASQNEETRKAHAQLRRYRAALHRFARSERQLPR